jgi:hypothetical protein
MKNKSALLLGLLLATLTACQATWFNELATPHGGRLFQDDFSDISSGWPSFSAAEGAYAYTDATYRISVISPSYQMWALSGRSYRDVQIEVDASRLAGPLANLYGLVCRSTDEVNYYFFIISSDGYYAIGKVSDGEVSLLGQEMMAYNAVIASGESTNHLRFDCQGTTLAGYVNGQMLAITEDAAFPSGDSGLIAGTFDEGGVEISFDNFVIFKP